MTSANSRPLPSVQESISPLEQSISSSPIAPRSIDRIPLPEQTTPPVQPDLLRADLLLALFVLLSAFLLASTPAVNSDL